MEDLFQKIKEKRIAKTLRYALIDGVLWSCMFGLAEDYLIPFALHFQTSPFFISLITGSAQLGISIIQLLGARFIGYHQKRKWLIIICNQFHAFSWILVLVLTYTMKNPVFIIVFYFIGVISTNFGTPAWLSWMNETVPARLRGEYWGKRNRIMGFFQFLATSTAGLTLYFFKNIIHHEFIGFAVIFTLAALFRSSSILPLSRMHEPQMKVPQKGKELTLLKFLKSSGRTNFKKFVLFNILMTFSVYFMPAMLSIHILKTLKFNYIQFALINMTVNIASFISMAYWGSLIDRFGNYAIMRLCAIGIILPSLLWAFLRNIYFILPIQIFSGFVWAGFNLTTFNFIFDLVKKEDISSATAITTSLNNIMAFLGSVIAGLISHFTPGITWLPFSALNLEIIFLISFLFRALTVLIFLPSFREVKQTEPVPSEMHFLVYFPARNIMNQIRVIHKKIMNMIQW
ncbi:MAG: MFS transporter [bacterium]|nr:MFS transporter [bacterium]